MTQPFADWPLEPVSKDDERVTSFRMLLAVIDRLRAPEGGCPWDLKQSEVSMGPSLVEEACEWIDAIDTGDALEAATEAGDVLMCTLLMCRIAQDEGRYDLGQASLQSAIKLVRRHPHVFGDVQQTESEAVLEQWEDIKRAEREAQGQQDQSVLSGLPKGLPALTRMARIVSKTTSAGFRWSSVQGAWDKIEEELAELRETVPQAALAAERKPELAPESVERIESELGDLIAAAAIFGNYLGLDPERACRLAAQRFELRFRHVEAALGERLQGAPLEELERAWKAAKRS
ncbi:MAG: nucleoside triphosphate pyrophosphohydrolase [Planctomycetes bacterium]|nr:nucleoside triphosphate pyrophosphohydrolase [Planctomycetota bacterium]MCB9909732.1 nucleoside triphosphate pyrophosphohydrolase [Planctomycetota bacterium]MCB9911778.1 nucleoside triphosphate pyrophosphohydrolase [Planctomycetota bacterium]HPF13290.1 nucleoside triphosphate pyrophosphohydrolase [Planctomycetota bacterium]HRV81503.1 nucleoside triphosphate pyrophosphohydrolase [Planctomycetota bacterium]